MKRIALFAIATCLWALWQFPGVAMAQCGPNGCGVKSYRMAFPQAYTLPAMSYVVPVSVTAPRTIMAPVANVTAPVCLCGDSCQCRVVTQSSQPVQVYTSDADESACTSCGSGGRRHPIWNLVRGVLNR